MGFESYFTLYRKYNTKASENEIKNAIKKYVKENKEMDYSDKKKSDEEYAKDIPKVLDPCYGEHGTVYNRKTKEWEDKTDHSVSGQRKTFNRILASDGSYLDELMSWHFISNFNCLCDEYGLGHGRNNDEAIIDVHTAEKMLQAVTYLLSGKWSDDTEDILDNRWIEVFANGNSGDSYWPYVYRKDSKRLNEIPVEERDGLKYTLLNTKYALEAFLKADDGRYNTDPWEYLLVYSISY